MLAKRLALEVAPLWDSSCVESGNFVIDDVETLLLRALIGRIVGRDDGLANFFICANENNSR
jgi:hypothetical protein